MLSVLSFPSAEQTSGRISFASAEQLQAKAVSADSRGQSDAEKVDCKSSDSVVASSGHVKAVEPPRVELDVKRADERPVEVPYAAPKAEQVQSVGQTKVKFVTGASNEPVIAVRPREEL